MAKDEVMRVFVFYLVVLVTLGILAAKSLVFIKPHERAVVLRLGKFVGVLSPGLNIVLPFVDRVVKVRLDQIQGHELMSEQQLLDKIAQLYR